MTMQPGSPRRSTYWQLIEGAAATQPDRLVVSDDYGRGLTIAELRDAALVTATALAESGVGAGTVVSWQLPTTLEAIVVMSALTRLGAIQNPIIPIWRENDVRHAMTQINAEMLIVPRIWRGFDHGDLARRLGHEREMCHPRVGARCSAPRHAPATACRDARRTSQGTDGLRRGRLGLLLLGNDGRVQGNSAQ